MARRRFDTGLFLLGAGLETFGNLLAFQRDEEEQERIAEEQRVAAEVEETRRLATEEENLASGLLGNVAGAESEAALRGIESQAELRFPDIQIGQRTRMVGGEDGGAPMAVNALPEPMAGVRARGEGRELRPGESERIAAQRRNREAITETVGARRGDLKAAERERIRAELEGRMKALRTGESTPEEVAAGSPELAASEGATLERSAELGREAQEQEQRDEDLNRRLKEAQIEATEAQIQATRDRGNAPDATPAERFAALAMGSAAGAELFTAEGLGKIMRGEFDQLDESDFAGQDSSTVAAGAIAFLQRLAEDKASNALLEPDERQITQADVEQAIEMGNALQQVLNRFGGAPGGATGGTGAATGAGGQDRQLQAIARKIATSGAQSLTAAETEAWTSITVEQRRALLGAAGNAGGR